VMLNEYGCDDMEYLLKQSSVPDTISIEARGKTHQLKVARFDNRVDMTSFVRDVERDKWTDEVKGGLHNGLKEALSRLVD